MKTINDAILYKINVKTSIKRYSTSRHNSDKTTIISGYGRCKACDCKGYISKHNDSHECKNCGHHYDRHYSA